MKIEDLEPIFDEILNKSEKLIKNGKREEILNERIFHHMFSNEVSSYFLEKKVDIWDSLLLVPEYPTSMKFNWEIVKLSNAKHAREEGLGKGKRGNFDFAIKSKPQIYIEFKGPELYKTKDIKEVMLKLLSEDDKSSLKVFAAMITSSKTGNVNHIREIENRFYEGLKFSLDVLEIKNLKEINLYAYVATILDNGQAKPIWGNCAQYEKELIEEGI